MFTHLLHGRVAGGAYPLQARGIVSACAVIVQFCSIGCCNDGLLNAVRSTFVRAYIQWIEAYGWLIILGR